MNWKETYQQEIVPFDFFHGMESGVCKVNDDFRMKKRIDAGTGERWWYICRNHV